jgi:ABC-2 type transport system permease protein
VRFTLAIAWKEIRGYFTSPVAYVVALMFVALTGYFFVRSVDSILTGADFPEASLRETMTQISIFILPWLAPVLTMRLLAEEQKIGTIELLLTSPVRDWEVVLGKFLAAMTFFLVTLALTFWYVLMLEWRGNPDLGPLLSGYLGIILYGGAAISIGLMASSFTSNQIVAAVISLGILVLLTFLEVAANQVTGVTATIVGQMGMTTHFSDFVRGIIDTGNIVYYVSLMAVFLFLTVRSLETRRWR